MRVLITNNSLVDRAGSEMYVRDVALELLRRGHQPVAYSTQLGPVAAELRAATVPVIDRLDSLGEPPDVIHGHHHYDTLMALLRFPETPALYYCHGWLPRQEAALRHPNILRYVAVDELCRERLITEGGIPPDRIEVIFNFFDQRVFLPRPPLPRVPKRALAFSNELTDQTGLAILREACARCGIELDACGLRNGNPNTRPGRLLADYDIVFAKARSAIEALGVGAAVVLCAPGKLGRMVTTENFATLRSWNFGIRNLSRPLEIDLVEAELQNYNPEDAARVATAARTHCELQPAVDRIVRVYERVLSEAKRPQSGDHCRAAAASAAQYLEYWANRYKENLGAMEDRDRWIDRCLRAEKKLTEQADQLQEITRLSEERSRELRKFEAERRSWTDRYAAAESTLAEQRRWIEQAAQQSLRTTNQLLAQRDREIARLVQELAALRGSATWRWTQHVLQSAPVQLFLGGLIRSVAERNQPAEELPDIRSSPAPDAVPVIPAGSNGSNPEPADAAAMDVQSRADRMISEQGFLGVPRETFAQAGREQLMALLAEGLRPDAKVLEFGCGCLRIAYWLVRFLDPRGYHGIEPARARVEYGLRYLFSPEEIRLKRPRFDFNAAFDSSVFGRKFDFFLARSIWTHASKPQIEATLDSFLRDSAPGAIFLASYLPANSDEEDYHGSAWVGTSHESNTPGVIRHALASIIAQCKKRGLTCEEIPGFDCDTQLWLRVRRAG